MGSAASICCGLGNGTGDLSDCCCQTCNTCLPSQCPTSYKGWKLSINPVAARKRYILDGTLPASCSLAQVEFRTLLDSPVAMRYFFLESTSSKLLIDLWLDCRDWTKLDCLQSVRLGNLLQRHQKVPFLVVDSNGITHHYLLEAILDEYDADCANGAIPTTEATLAMFDRVQELCFKEMFATIYMSFIGTPAYDVVCRLISDPDSWVTASSFEYGDVIATGSFGIVAECKKKSTGGRFAMKIQPKAVLLRHFQQDKSRVMTEMQAYAALDHPYVTKLAYATQTASLAMLVMPISECGDLSKSLKFTELGAFSAERVQFYVAEIVSALIYLHHFGFIYRDLKLANILLNADGHIVLADFGSLADTGGVLRDHFSSHAGTSNCQDPGNRTFRPLDAESEGGGSSSVRFANSPEATRLRSTSEHMAPASQPSDHFVDASVWQPPPAAIFRDPVESPTAQSTSRTKSLVGTMEYMAPEVLCMFGKRLAHKDGYTAAVDWWGLGVLTYHMITGAVPFRRVSYKTLEARMPKLLQQDASFATVFKKTFGSVSYDHPSFSPDTISLLKELLTFDPDQRLGGTGLWEDVQTSNCPLRSHAFFKGVDWQLIERKAIRPPYLPHEEVRASISAGAYSSCIDSSITELLLRNNKVEWIDDDMEFVYTPNVRFSSFLLSMNSLLRGSDSVSSKDSSGRQMFGIGSPKKVNKVTPLTAEALAAHEMYRVKESDQVHFYGWNYVSQDLLETGKSTTDIVSTVNSISYSHSRGKSSYHV